ncbi:apolipoprotein D-like isoform X1 [Eurosta solidaginis]|uniref:apolipoprotein D-like isoform X1 n=1 Tax=Eurosta solidaginis TaxID=178769 RepID=UPI003530D9EF
MLKHQFAIVPLSVFIFLTSSCLVAGGLTKPGRCPKIAYNKKLDLKGLTGTWYMQSSFEKIDLNRCQKSDYSLGDNDEPLVQNFQINRLDGSAECKTGKLIFHSDGQFQLMYGKITLPFHYKILSVDYEKYIIFYLCENIESDKHTEYVFIHTRDLEPSDKVKEDYLSALKAKKISQVELVPALHKDCGDYGKSVTDQLKKVQQELHKKNAKKGQGLDF